MAYTETVYIHIDRSIWCDTNNKGHFMAEIIDDIAHLSQEIGPHPAGTEEEQQAALYLAEKLQREAGFSTIIEDFQCITNPYLVRVICFAVALVSVIVPLVAPVAAIPCLVLCILAAVLYYLEVLGKPVLSRLFRSGASQNVVAKYQPGGAAGNTRRRKVILVANYDSGRVLQEEKEPLSKLLPLLQKASAIALIVAPVILLLKTVFFAGDTGALSAIFTVIFVACAVLFVLPLIRAALFAAAPYNQSANNNASGVSVLLEVARMVGRGLVSTAEMDERAAREPSVVHGEEAARAAGVVPDGATLEYETEESGLSPQESLAAAKAAIAALTGKPVADKVPVTDISSRLVKGGGLTPEDETATSVHFEVGSTPHRTESSRSKRMVVSPDDDLSPLEETPDTPVSPVEHKPAKSGPERLKQAAPQSPVAQIAAAEAARAMAEAEAAKARAELEAQAASKDTAAGFERTTPEALQQGMTGAMAQIDKTPAWARSAQAKARANKPEASQPHTVSRSQYADTLAAQLLERPARAVPQAYTAPGDATEEVAQAGEQQPELTPEQAALAARVAALRSEIEATPAPHMSDEAKAALADLEQPLQEGGAEQNERARFESARLTEEATPAQPLQEFTNNQELQPSQQSHLSQQIQQTPPTQHNQPAPQAEAVQQPPVVHETVAEETADITSPLRAVSGEGEPALSSAEQKEQTSPALAVSEESSSLTRRPSARSNGHSLRGGFASRFKEVTSRVSHGLADRKAHDVQTDEYFDDSSAVNSSVDAQAKGEVGSDENLGKTQAFAKQLHGSVEVATQATTVMSALDSSVAESESDEFRMADGASTETDSGSTEPEETSSSHTQPKEQVIKASASPQATAAISPIDVSAFLDKEDESKITATPSPQRHMPHSAYESVDGATLSDEVTQRVSSEEIQEAINEASVHPVTSLVSESDNRVTYRESEGEFLELEEVDQQPPAAAPVASPIVGMEALLPSISAPQPAVDHDSEQPRSQVIVLPSVSASHTVNTDELKQRAPMADASESTQAGTKSLLSNMLPKIDDPGTSAPLPSLGDTEDGITGLDLPALGDTGPVQAVSMTGSFSTVGGTGSFAPVGDELVADVDPEDRYVDDADDSAYDEEYTETGAFAGPGYVEMPKSRAGRFFNRFRSKKKRAKQQEDMSVREWVNVGEDYNARSVGQARGDWSSFRQEEENLPVQGIESYDNYADDTYKEGYADTYDGEYVEEYVDEYGNQVVETIEDQTYADEYAPAPDGNNGGFVEVDYHETSFDNRRGWNGGAFSLSRMRQGLSAGRKDTDPELADQVEYEEDGYVETDPAVRVDGHTEAAEQINRELKKLQDFRHPDIDTEVWFVALGAELYSHSGMNAFLDEHADEMKGAIIINLEALGSGELSCLEREGVLKSYKPSSRSKRFLRQASERSGVTFRSAALKSRETPASLAMARGIQALTIAGMGDTNTVLYAAENDIVENLDETCLNDSARFVMAILKSI